MVIEERNPKKTIIIVITLLMLLTATVSGVFYFKPMGDQYPFDTFLYDTSNITKTNYRILSPGKGEKLKNGELIILDLSYRKIKHTNYIYKQTPKKGNEKTGIPLIYQKEALKNKGEIIAVLTEILGMIKLQGHARIIIKAKQLFPTNGEEKTKFYKQYTLTDDSKLVLDLKIKNIVQIQKKIKEKLEKDKTIIKSAIENFKSKHPKLIFSKIHNKKGDDTGIYYSTLIHGKGIKLKKDDKIEFELKARYLNEPDIINKDLKYQKFIIILGDKNTSERFRGLNYIFPKMKIGDKIKIFVPSIFQVNIEGVSLNHSKLHDYEVRVIRKIS